jgi:hypothetical protein
MFLGIIEFSRIRGKQQISGIDPPDAWAYFAGGLTCR